MFQKARSVRYLLTAIALAATCFFLLPACSSFHNWLEVPESELDTHSKLNRTFHVVAQDPQGAGFRFPCILLGVEKTEREIIAAPNIAEDEHLNHQPGNITSDTSDEEKHRIHKLREVMSKRLDDSKRTFISHAVDYQLEREPIPHIKANFIYDAYGPDPRRGSEPRLPKSAKLYEDSWQVLEEVRALLRTRLTQAEDKYTHLIFGTMGWNTAQAKGMRNLNSLFANLMLAAQDNANPSRSFRPIFVALTWPSEWNVPVISYFNKANDADEIGLVWANALLNDVMCGLRDEFSSAENPLKVVTLGHSFGARLVTRAAFSGEALERPRSLQDGADLVLSLQGAFSMNRFLAERKQGREGYPYANYEDLRGRVAMTWSDGDKANPLANKITGENLSGGTPGFKRADKYDTHFKFNTATPDGFLTKPIESGAKQPLMIDASDLIRYQVHGTGGGSHSDVYNRDVGRLLWQLISELAP